MITFELKNNGTAVQIIVDGEPSPLMHSQQSAAMYNLTMLYEHRISEDDFFITAGKIQDASSLSEMDKKGFPAFVPKQEVLDTLPYVTAMLEQRMLD